MRMSLPTGWRWLVGAFILLAAGIVVSARVNSDVEASGYWGASLAQAVTLWSAGFLAGCVVRRWGAVALALLPILTAVPFGLKEGGGWLLDPHPVAYSMAALAVFCAAFIAAGVGAATIVHSLRRRGSAPAAG